LTVRARWQPFQDLGEDDPRGPRDEMDLMRGMLARALGRDGGRQVVASGTSAAWAPTLDISEGSDAYLVALERPGVEAVRSTATPSASIVAPPSDG